MVFCGCAKYFVGINYAAGYVVDGEHHLATEQLATMHLLISKKFPTFAIEIRIGSNYGFWPFVSESNLRYSASAVIFERQSSQVWINARPG